MAIIVEQEEKGKGGWGGILTGVLVIAVIGIAVYYIFFKRPDLVEYATPANFQNLEQISSLRNLSADEVVNSQAFRALQPRAEELNPQTSGRPNPFLGTF